MSLRERLKRLTKPFHDETENYEFGKKIFAGTITKDEMCILLNAFYSVVAPIEDAIVSHRESFLELGLDISKRVKANIIREDISRLGGKVTKINTDVLKDRSFCAVVGMMYVLEGSTMGGQVISERLRELDLPFDYFLPYKERSMAMWQEFISFLERCENSRGFDIEACIIGACSTFLRLGTELNKLNRQLDRLSF